MSEVSKYSCEHHGDPSLRNLLLEMLFSILGSRLSDVRIPCRLEADGPSFKPREGTHCPVVAASVPQSLATAMLQEDLTSPRAHCRRKQFKQSFPLRETPLPVENTRIGFFFFFRKNIIRLKIMRLPFYN